MDQEQWAVVELLGHVRHGAKVSEEELAGSKCLRLEIPLGEDKWVTKLVGAAAVYAITFCDEASARAVASRNHPQPVHLYEMPPALAFNDPEDDDYAGSDFDEVSDR